MLRSIFTAFLLLPLFFLHAASTSEPVEITRILPDGESVAEIRQITLSFNQKMVPLGQMATTAERLGLTITPAVKCQWRWLDPSNLSCELGEKESLKPANAYTLKIKPGLKSEAGGVLAQEYTRQFSTARPKFTWHNFLEWRHPGSPRINIQFNQEVDEGSVVKAASFQTALGAVGARLVADKDINEKQVGWGYRHHGTNSVVVEPVKPLPLDQNVTLNLSAGVISKSGPLKGEAAQVVSFDTFPEFKFLGITCTDENGLAQSHEMSATGECSPLGGVALIFSAPVLKEELQKKLKVTPTLSAKGKEEQVWESVPSYSHLAQPHKSGETYSVMLPHFLLARKDYRLEAAGIADQFSRRLPGTIDYRFKTTARQPRMTVPNHISVLEKEEKTEVPAFVTNLQEVDFQFQRMTPKGTIESGSHKIKVPKSEDNSFAIPLEVRKMTNGSGAISGSISTVPVLPHVDFQIFSEVTPFQVVMKAGHMASSAWVTDLKTGQPVAGAKVEILVRSRHRSVIELDGGQPFTSAVTGANGIAEVQGFVKWPKLENNQVYVARVTKQNDMALLPLDWEFTASRSEPYIYDEEEGYSGGWSAEYSHAHSWGMTAQGVYKVGDKVQYKFFVRNQSNRHYVKPPSKSYTLTIVNPGGDEVFKKEDIALNEFGSYAGQFDLPPTVPVGWYRAYLEADFLGKRKLHPFRFLVADFTPVPFKVETLLNAKKAHPGDEVKIGSKASLHAGGPFAKAPVRVVGTFTANTWHTDNPELVGFNFDTYASADREVFRIQEKLDAKGEHQYILKIPTLDHTYGTLHVESAVQDDRGKNSAGFASIEYSGLDRRVGLKLKSWDNKTNEKLNLIYVVADEAGKPASGTKVNIEFQFQETKVAKVKGAGNAYLNQYTTKWTKAGTCTGTSKSSPATCDFTPTKPGSYKAIASIEDTKGRAHKIEEWMYVTGPGYITWESDETQPVEIIPEKKEYNVGEKAKFLIKNPLPGATALFSIERYGVIKSWTATLKNSAELIELPIEDDFMPGFTLSVAITSPRVQSSEPLGQVDLGKPTARFGSMNITVADPYKKIEVEAKPDKAEYRPREKVKIDLKTHVLHPRAPAENVELAVVVLDEAVLNLIQGHSEYYDIYKGFYSHNGIDVHTFNLIARLVGRQKFEKKGANPGGAGGLSQDLLMRNLLKYVAYWNPSLKPEKNGHKEISFTLPDNLTGWRVLVMAVTPTDRMGLGQGSFKSNQPTELRPVLPNQVTEGDKFRAGFSVLNRADKARKINVHIAAEGLVKGAKGLTQDTTLDLQPFERKSVWMDLQTTAVDEKRELAAGQIKFKVTAGDAFDKDGLVQEMPVLKKRTLETAATYGSMTEDKVTESMLFPKDIYADVGKVSVTLAPSVIGNVEGAFRYVRDYPYLCWEQRLTKGVMASHYSSLKPYLPAVDWPEAKKQAQTMLDDAANFQAPNGGMVYWVPTEERVSPYLSAYTAVAFVWLREAGYKIPENVEHSLQNYLKEYLKNDVQTTFYDLGMRSTVRAVALYALIKRKVIGVDEVKRFLPVMPNMSLFGQSFYLMAAIEGEGSMQRDETLRVILNKASRTSGKFSFNETLSDGYAQLLSTPVRDNCAVLSAIVRAEKDPAAKKTVADIPMRLMRSLTQTKGKRDHFENTQENMFCLQALIDYAKVYEATPPHLKAEARMDGKSFGAAEFNKITDPLKTLDRPLEAKDPGRKTDVVITRKGEGRLYYSARMSYALREEKADVVNAGIDMRREYYVQRDSKWVALTTPAKVKRGELVRVDLFVSLPTARNFVAVNDPVPGGLEPVNRDLADTSEVDAKEGLYPTGGGSFYFQFGDWTEFDLTGWTFYHRELRHDSARFFSDYLPPGHYRLSYTAQAIATGEFSAGPTHVEEMYDPDVFGKSRPNRFEIGE